MSIVQRYVDYADRHSRPNRALSLTGALFCAAFIGFLLGSDRGGPERARFVFLFTGLLLLFLRDLVGGPRWLRFILLPITSLVLLITSFAMLVRAHVM